MELLVQLPYSPFLPNWVFTEESGIRQFSWRMPSIQMQGDTELYTGRIITFCNTYFQHYFEKNLDIHGRIMHSETVRKLIDFFSVISHVNKPLLICSEEWPLVVLCTYWRKYYLICCFEFLQSRGQTTSILPTSYG